MLIGYARVSSDAQTTALQLDALKKAGVEHVYQENVSGAAPLSKRPALRNALLALGKGDVLVIWRLDRLARSVSELTTLMATIEGQGADVKSLTEDLNTTTPSGRLTFHIFSALAQFEKELTAQRC